MTYISTRCKIILWISATTSFSDCPIRAFTNVIAMSSSNNDGLGGRCREQSSSADMSATVASSSQGAGPRVLVQCIVECFINIAVGQAVSKKPLRLPFLFKTSLKWWQNKTRWLVSELKVYQANLNYN